MTNARTIAAAKTPARTISVSGKSITSAPLNRFRAMAAVVAALAVAEAAASVSRS